MWLPVLAWRKFLVWRSWESLPSRKPYPHFILRYSLSYATTDVRVCDSRSSANFTAYEIGNVGSSLRQVFRLEDRSACIIRAFAATHIEDGNLIQFRFSFHRTENNIRPARIFSNFLFLFAIVISSQVYEA